MRKVPARFQEFAKRYPKIMTSYEELAAECRRSGPLTEREQALVKLGIAAGSQMEGAVHSQVRKALDLGLQPEEIRQAFLLALPSTGFPKMMAALTWAEDILNQEKA
jgi:alkylhydroperoxidase/carboxymuconolactone decarboxylase family protein YurZ